ncbi:YdbC family protein [Clostridium celatum]|uniref:YdbC family protein n=1 Tax=Clostridium celatum TaxID=36834 RepID=UPI001F1F5E78|nr:YdbC family protein [Clostridium celatum]MCE9656255.1 YdbC family protein [Clostridium celatum]
MTDIKFEIKENIVVLSETTKGWSKELNRISWNGKEAKYDLRDWAPEHEKMGKGITLTRDELRALKEALNNMDI